MTLEQYTDPTGTIRVENIVTSGTFSLDGGSWEVDNNVWIVGDDERCLLIDPAHDSEAVLTAVDGREVTAIVLTHGHDDHIRAVGEIADRTGATVHLNPADEMLWRDVYSEAAFQPISDGQKFAIAPASPVTMTAIHTPGHSPGSTCFHAPALGRGGVVFSGDTLFNGGPGATGRSYSDFGTIIASIRDRLFTLPETTEVLTGHGDSTRIGVEKPQLDDWIARGA